MNLNFLSRDITGIGGKLRFISKIFSLKNILTIKRELDILNFDNNMFYLNNMIKKYGHYFRKSNSMDINLANIQNQKTSGVPDNISIINYIRARRMITYGGKG